jgi:hypothetical protein
MISYARGAGPEIGLSQIFPPGRRGGVDITTDRVFKYGFVTAAPADLDGVRMPQPTSTRPEDCHPCGRQARDQVGRHTLMTAAAAIYGPLPPAAPPSHFRHRQLRAGPAPALAFLVFPEPTNGATTMPLQHDRANGTTRLFQYCAECDKRLEPGWVPTRLTLEGPGSGKWEWVFCTVACLQLWLRDNDPRPA